MTLFVLVYAAALCCYFVTRTGDKIVHRAVNKYILATMYLVYAIIKFAKDYDFVSVHLLLMAALFMAWLGDVFLVFDLGRGGDFFLAGNVCFALYEHAMLLDQGRKNTEFVWVYLCAAVMVAAFAFLCGKYPEIIKVGKMRWPMTLYLSSIFTHGLTGLAMILLLPGTRYALMGLGSLLFMISDMILTVDRFIIRKNKWIVRSNSLTYFSGLLLIVLGM